MVYELTSWLGDHAAQATNFLHFSLLCRLPAIKGKSEAVRACKQTNKQEIKIQIKNAKYASACISVLVALAVSRKLSLTQCLPALSHAITVIYDWKNAKNAHLCVQ